MGNFWKYNDRVSTGAGVSGLTTADGGDAIGNNELIRGDGTTGIQGGLLTSADHNGDIAGPTTGSDTTAVGIAYTNQPSNDSVQILSSDAGDVAVDITIIGTTTGTDTVVVEVLATDATDGTTPVTSVKTNWGQILAIKKPVTIGTITIQKTTGPATVTTLLAAATSSGVAAASNTANAWNRLLTLVGSGATTKQVGIKGTNSAGATIYDSQALTGTTVAYSNSAFVEVHEFYIGDLEATRTLTASTQAGVGIATITGTSADGDIKLDAQGTGQVYIVGPGTAAKPALVFGPADSDTGIYWSSADTISYTVGGALSWYQTGVSFNAYRTNFHFIYENTGDIGHTRQAAGILRISNGSSGLGWTYQDGYKALDTDFTNATATMQNLTGLTVTLKTGRKYTFRMVLFVSNSTAGEGVAIDFDGGTATATDFRCHARVFDTALLLSAQTTALATDIAQATITGASMIEVDGSFTVNAAGTFIPRASENTTATGTLTVETGSYLWVRDTSFS